MSSVDKGVPLLVCLSTLGLQCILGTENRSHIDVCSNCIHLCQDRGLVLSETKDRFGDARGVYDRVFVIIVAIRQRA